MNPNYAGRSPETKPPHHSADILRWRVISIVLGILFVILPLVQNYLLFRPMVAALEFVPLSYYLKEMLPTIILANATLLAGVSFFLGGILLAIGNRWGYILTVSASAFSLVLVVEGLIFFLFTMARSENGISPIMEEMYSLAGIFPLLVLILEIVALVLLNLKGKSDYLC
jgi:hypothetical protein